MPNEAGSQEAGGSPGLRTLAERLEKLAVGLVSHLEAVTQEPVRQALEGDLEELRRVASSLRGMALLSDGRQPGALAKREEELKSIAVSVGQSIRELATTYRRVGVAMGDQLQSLDEIAELPPGEEMVSRLRAAAGHVRDAAADVQEQAEKAASHVDEANTRIADLERELTEARERALHDHLTRLYSRGALDERLQKTIDEGDGRGAWCFLLGDIDHFKSVNDRLGHVVGDALLFKVARIMEAALRDEHVEGFVARYGGEEFGIILPRGTLAAATKAAERIRSVLATSRWQFRGGQNESILQATISIGVAQYRRGDTPASLIERADEALYRAKREGRNRVVVAEP